MVYLRRVSQEIGEEIACSTSAGKDEFTNSTHVSQQLLAAGLDAAIRQVAAFSPSWFVVADAKKMSKGVRGRSRSAARSNARTSLAYVSRHGNW